MGVTGTLIVMVLVIGVFVELRIVRNVPFLYQLVKRSSLAGLAVSIAITMAFATLLGIATFIGGVAGLGAAIITGLVYKASGSFSKRDPKTKHQHEQLKADAKATYRPIWSAFKLAVIILTSPLWVPVWLRRKIRGPAPVTV